MHRGLKRKALFASLILALSCALWPAASGAGPREDLLNLARVLSYQKKYDESLARYDDYLAKYPGDMQAQLEAGDVSFWSGDYDRALSHYKKVLERTPSDIDTRIKVAELLSYEKRYDESIAQYDCVLKEDPGNLRAMRGRADVLSWDQRFDESVTAYDELLEKKYDADAARQKARVLGWAKHYGESLRAYSEAYERSGTEAIRLERDGKKAFWNSWPLHAIESYRDALTEEPDNAEARFDLGQTEGYERMWPEASSDFSNILEKMPGHFRARDSFSRVETLRKKRDLAPEFYWFRAKSPSRDTDIDRYTAGFSFRQPIKPAFGIDAGYYFDFFRFGNAGSIPRDQGKIGLDFSVGPKVWGQAFYLPTGYPSDNRFSNLWKGSVSVRAMDQLILTAFSNREDLYNQRIVFVKGLHQTDLGGLIESRLHRRVTAYAAYRYRTVNDSNKQNSAGVEGLFYMLYEPKRLTLDLRFDWQDWRYTTTDYWSPQNFWHISGTLHWRHYLNPNGMYYGALNTYYGFKYRFQIDRDKRPFNGGAFEFHRDWSRRLETSVEAFGDYSSVYWDLGAMASVVLRF